MMVWNSSSDGTFRVRERKSWNQLCIIHLWWLCNDSEERKCINGDHYFIDGRTPNLSCLYFSIYPSYFIFWITQQRNICYVNSGFQVLGVYMSWKPGASVLKASFLWVTYLSSSLVNIERGMKIYSGLCSDYEICAYI